MLNSKALAASVSAGPAVYVEDVFSTFLYTGTGSTQTITNGIDLSGKGGLVWIKRRTTSGASHELTDTARGASKYLFSNSTAAEANGAPDTGATSFLSTGFTVGNDGFTNGSGSDYASWTFRKQPKFFDVVTFTSGTNTNRRISHALGSAPGMIIVKRTDGAQGWYVYHRSTGRNGFLGLETTDAFGSLTNSWGTSDPTSTDFGIDETSLLGASRTYVAYVFAHNAGGFGTAGTDNVVSCGSFTKTASWPDSTPVVLGWEPQFVLFKRIDAGSTENWNIGDVMRGASNTTGVGLSPNLNNAETSTLQYTPLATGFTIGNSTSIGGTYIYIAIRRGPMKTPTVGTSVFEPAAYTGNGTNPRTIGTLQVTDLAINMNRPDTGDSPVWIDRLRGGGRYLASNATSAEAGGFTGWKLEQTGQIINSIRNTSPTTYIDWLFRRAPGFFDVVAYAGSRSAFDGGSTAITHNLGVAPELMIIKSRTSGSYNWSIYSTPTGNTDWLSFDTFGPSTNINFWNNTSPTASNFTVGSSTYVNVTGQNYIAYLFASCPGVSKVGSYTGTGTTQQINCGFTAGARFILIKRVDGASGSDWYVWDTARGIISGNDPYLLINSTAAEVTGTDYIDPLSSGFEISSTAPAAINANGGSYIFLSIA